MSAENVLEFTDTNFNDEVLNSKVPVLADFWAEWCMPCRMIAPIVEELAAEYAGKAKFGRVDVDTNRQTAMQFGIQAIPTLILFKSGRPAKKFVGLKSKTDMAEAIDALLE